MRTSRPGQSALLLLDVIDILKTLEIRYAIVGAFAASFYGLVRASMDADALISLQGSKQKVEQLLTELKKQDFNIEYRKGDFNDPIASLINVQDCFHNRVDLLMGIKGMGEEVFSRVIYSKFTDTEICIVGIEDFIVMKVFAAGQKDMEDARGVLKISSSKVNFPLLKELASGYGQEVSLRLKSVLQGKLKKHLTTKKR